MRALPQLLRPALPKRTRRMPSPAGLRQSRAHGLFLALLCSYSCFQATDSAPKLKSRIFSTLQYSPSFGQELSVVCEGYTAYKCNGIMYWLANGTFVDNLFPDEAVSEKKTREKAQGPGCALERELLFHTFSQRDLGTLFECIILDPSGPVRKTITWNLRGTREGRRRVPEGH